VEDVTDAVEWLFENGENYGYDPDRIALDWWLCRCAPGHACRLRLGNFGVQNDSAAPPYRIKAVVDIYGPVDLTTEYARNTAAGDRLHRPFV
jgi:hypothetical protein